MATPPKGARRPMDRLAAEATADETVAELAGVSIRILSPLDWKKSAAPALSQLDFDRWAAGAVHPDDVAKFVGADATVRETLDFVNAVEERAGIDMGEYLASRRS